MRKARVVLILTAIVAILVIGCRGETPTVISATSASDPSAIASPSIATPTEAPTDVSQPKETADPTAIPSLESNVLDGELDDFVDGMDCFPDKIVPAYATGFTVDYYDTYKVVKVPQAWAGAEHGFTYVLYQRGTPAPEGFENATLIPIPADTVISMSTSYLAQMDLLGIVDRLVGVDAISYASTPSVIERFQAGKIAEIGYGQDVNVERTIEANPSLVLTYGLGNEWDSHPKLLEAGITTVLSAESRAGDPLARAEWIKFIALFFNREAMANEVFDAVEERYLSLVDLATDVEEHPTVFLNAPWGDTWYMAGGQSYVANLLRAAGADYLWADDPSSDTLYLDFETVYEQGLEADYWLHTSTWSSLDEAIAADERFADFSAVQSGQVYNNNRRTNANGGNDYWESGLINPDVILLDLISIFHPELVPDHELVYYQKLAPLSDE